MAIHAEVREEGVLINLIFARPQPRLPVEIRPKEFSHESLGDRRNGSSRLNFKILVGSLLRPAKAARRADISLASTSTSPSSSVTVTMALHRPACG